MSLHMGDPCCASAHDTLTAEALSLEDLAADPALEACCRRDLEERAEVARLKAELSLHDRSSVRQQLATAVIRQSAPPPAQGGNEAEEAAEEDDERELLERLRAQRLVQMQAEARRKAELQAQGAGELASTSEAGLLERVRACEQPVVAHLAFEGWEVGDALDEHLAALAHRHLGTRFLRVRTGPRSTLHLRLGPPPGPGLVCFWEGSMLGAAGLEAFGAPESCREEEVDAWLCRLGVLHTPESLERWAAARQAAGGSGRGRGGARGESDSGGEDEGEEEQGSGDWQQPCEVCGRRYPHQHVRSLYADRPSDSSDEEEAEAAAERRQRGRRW